jgi:ubiquinone/menaquinone biosynthesis C-methylase UbiE
MPSNALHREYAMLGPGYEQRWRHYLNVTTARTLEALAPQGGERILDVACGTGFALAHLADMPAALHLAGLDFSHEMLARARIRLPPAVLLAHGDARHLPFPAARFDAVTITSALHYLDDPATALGEMARVLVPGGRLIITDWCRNFFTMLLCEHWLRIRQRPLGRLLRIRELAALAEHAGFRMQSLTRFRVRPAWGMMTLVAVKEG